MAKLLSTTRPCIRVTPLSLNLDGVRCSHLLAISLDWVNSVKWSRSNPNWFISASSDKTIKVTDLAADKPFYTARTIDDSNISLVFTLFSFVI